MRLLRLTAAAALLGLAAACGTTTSGDFTSPLIDQPTAPFPYNSRFCP
jgi:hypothetical protein